MNKQTRNSKINIALIVALVITCAFTTGLLMTKAYNINSAAYNNSALLIGK